MPSTICIGNTKSGRQCRKYAVKNSLYCAIHKETVEEDSSINENNLNEQLQVAAASLMPIVDENITDLERKFNDLQIELGSLSNFKKILNKAKSLYYKDLKKNQDLQDYVHNMLSNTGLYPNKKDIPWMVVKRTTDVHFDQQPETTKKQYYEKARMEMSGIMRDTIANINNAL